MNTIFSRKYIYYCTLFYAGVLKWWLELHKKQILSNVLVLFISDSVRTHFLWIIRRLVAYHICSEITLHMLCHLTVILDLCHQMIGFQERCLLHSWGNRLQRCADGLVLQPSCSSLVALFLLLLIYNHCYTVATKCLHQLLWQYHSDHNR